MISAPRKRSYASTLLLILFTAIVGQEVHIYNEDPLHFAAFCRDLTPDNGADSQVVEQCPVCNFCFHPCICSDLPAVTTYFELLGHPADIPTSSKCRCEIRLSALRAPPAVV